MKMFEVKYESGEINIIFADSRADAWYKHPMAWTIIEVVVK